MTPGASMNRSAFLGGVDRVTQGNLGIPILLLVMLAMKQPQLQPILDRVLY